MKKFFAIAFIATAMVACNNSGEKKGTDGDTTKADTAAVVAPVDTATVVAPADTTAKPAADTAK
jgi:hypothetical protein